MLNSTTEEDTEEEIPPTPTNKKSKRRRRNFSSSTSSSYSSSLATNSTAHSSNVTPATSKKPSGEGQSSSTVSKDLIAYRTRSRTQSVERGVEIETSSRNISLGQKRKLSRASKSQLLSDSDIEDDSQEEQSHNVQSGEKSDKNISRKKTIAKSLRSVRGAGGSGSRKSSEKSNNKKSDNSTNSVNSDNKNQQVPTASRTLRSRTTVVEQSQSIVATNLRRKPASVSTSVIPKKRHRIQCKTSASTNPESTGSGVPNLGARLARNQGGREPHNPSAQQHQDTSAHASTSTQQQTGHPPQNLLRRSSRGKGASSSSTTGSCVSLDYTD